MPHAPLDADHVSRRWLGKETHELAANEASVVRSAAERRPISEDVNEAFDDRQSFGDRLADRVAEFGGSWTFLIAFGLFLVTWTLINLVLRRDAFDPYPFIFLNLMLSMIAAAQAPIIMMSQNRQASKDRLDAGNDYQVNLKAEIEIMALLDKVEHLTARQQEQTELIERLLAEKER
ncbi:MAG: hypothetical protein B7Y85_03990 [Brevundimonas sp. 32-68-21]|jgi:uncharacterized membrane protein|uniref:DUF1003 domain-containing protein n=1 Tax=Brevundimonas mediterranea TaxID=74329 RepID=A0AB37E467_9CAUL|nr:MULTISPECIES: DUF1003 domain-containing protein [Brevundimonas]MDZ4320980.1 DUF1003 domain-containing protein [Phenylobacterium sp.]OGN47246.1 MAG: hypothetical protein A3E24_00045 [Caulobacterales bacterium RIFCSPHIGHO2_12_FULL_68_13]OYX80905.1 MAG: hypothetical protein B7Y85_03990 [Brevundimonas sp. 32-68-21]PZO00353.1 MAG: DUF1003 domain-containing protein [Alphaproteobacteria bacterium]EDX80119.1 conserved hypothetical protein [Brevundimonas sp. BAL3]